MVGNIDSDAYEHKQAKNDKNNRFSPSQGWSRAVRQGNLTADTANDHTALINKVNLKGGCVPVEISALMSKTKGYKIQKALVYRFF